MQKYVQDKASINDDEESYLDAQRNNWFVNVQDFAKEAVSYHQCESPKVNADNSGSFTECSVILGKTWPTRLCCIDDCPKFRDLWLRSVTSSGVCPGYRLDRTYDSKTGQNDVWLLSAWSQKSKWGIECIEPKLACVLSVLYSTQNYWFKKLPEFSELEPPLP